MFLNAATQSFKVPGRRARAWPASLQPLLQERASGSDAAEHDPGPDSRRCRYKRSMQLKAATVRTWVVLGCIAAARALLGVVAAARRARRVRGGPVL